MEFVIVRCGNQQRTVFIDNQLQGVTDTRLSVPEGLHVFDLGAPQNYVPPFQQLMVENTTSTDPMLIPFTVLGLGVAPPLPPPPPPAPRGARTSKPPKPRKAPKKASSKSGARGKKSTGSKKAAGRGNGKKKKAGAKAKSKKR